MTTQRDDVDLLPPDGSAAEAADVNRISECFGLVVRQARLARGWSQERLAARAELNRSYMGEIERAAAVPSLATAAKLALALEVPLSDLIQRCERAPSRVLLAPQRRPW